MPLKKITINLEEQDIKALDRLAEQQNTTRVDIIRNSIAQNGINAANNPITVHSLQEVSIAIRKRFHGIFTAQQAEQAAAVAICTIAKNRPEEAG